MNAPTSSASSLLRRASPVKRRKDGGNEPIRVLIVDDSLTVRTIFRRMVESDPALEVSATASSGERAIGLLKNTPVDVVLLDLEMPGIGGLAALPSILEVGAGAEVLVVSSLTDDGAEATVEALSTGAADTMLKPRPGGFNEDYRSQLLGKIRALGGKSDKQAVGDSGSKPLAAEAKAPKAPTRTKHPHVIAIGASTGGIHALNLMLRAFKPALSQPILITQHLPASFIPVFARQVETASGRRTHIADDGTEIRPGEIAIATGHGHMVVRRIGGQLVTRTSAEPVRSGCLPSVDPMLSSLAQACDGHVLAVILSGMGRDGLAGAEDVVKAGGAVWAQNAETCAVWGMPGSVTKAGLASFTGSPETLGSQIMTKLARASQGSS